MTSSSSVPPLQERDVQLERIAQELAKQRFAVWDNFLSTAVSRLLEEEVLSLFKNDLFEKAGVGTAHLHEVNRSVRSDYIQWIGDGPKSTALKVFFTLLEELIHFLNRSCFLGIRDNEFHFAVYPKGAFYKRHIDQPRINGNRIISAICYLNSDWQATDGGELRIYDANGAYLDVAPTAGKLVLMESAIVEHEVLPAHRPRVSITGWLLNQPKELSFI